MTESFSGQPDDFAAGPVPEQSIQEETRRRIRAFRVAHPRTTVILDDDPTGSQCVYGIPVVTVPEGREVLRSLEHPSKTCFVWTNSRSLSENEAVGLTRNLMSELVRLLPEDADLEIVSRSDSTLRGHVVAEVEEIKATSLREAGNQIDGVLFAPSFIEAGRVTVRDVHNAGTDGHWQPVAETEFANDVNFGYSNSNLGEFLREKSGGFLDDDMVVSIPLERIRQGGVPEVAEFLKGIRGGKYIIVNAVHYSDLETVSLAVLMAQGAGRRFMYRTGPSYVRAMLGLEPRGGVTTQELWPSGRPAGHGLIVVGSHVGLTTRQVRHLLSQRHAVHVELEVPRLLFTDAEERAQYVVAKANESASALKSSLTVVSTSREVVSGVDQAENLDIARTVSAALSQLVRRVVTGKPAWILAKGGITSHELAVTGLGMVHAEVVGQLFSGAASVLVPSGTAQVGYVPYVVFAGNVGGERGLTEAVDVLEPRALSIAAHD